MNLLDDCIFIPNNVPSSKNSKVKTSKGVFHSKTVKKYLQKLGVQKFSVSKKEYTNYKTRDNEFEKIFKDVDIDRSSPIIVKFHFVRDSRRKFDFHNVCQIVLDLMVAHDVIEDDNMDYIIPVPMYYNGGWYSIDKESPGVYISFQSEQDYLGGRLDAKFEELKNILLEDIKLENSTELGYRIEY